MMFRRDGNGQQNMKMDGLIRHRLLTIVSRAGRDTIIFDFDLNYSVDIQTNSSKDGIGSVNHKDGAEMDTDRKETFGDSFRL